MTVTAITSYDQFESIIKDNKVVLIDFWATWCGPCRMISPIFEKLADQHGSKVFFANLDVDTEDLGSRIGIRAMPTFYLYVNGERAGEVVGAKPADLSLLVNEAVAAAEA
ncbi:hypothetical protein OC842_001939 [Tilletia horrida]|uniref:Thioredoxin n=1 Tax=Tilletia horrida TaxID=155126 RepID=A0AAN6JMW2_9BASI|nr:hypothetical protein OC842_001939 [Tilletia horrida]